MNWGIPSKKAALGIALGAIALLALCPARADELKLKDGTKITGTIVGFEENSFKVKTSYGYAEVQKDQVVSISISDAAKKPEPEKKSGPAASKSPAAVDSDKADASAKAVPTTEKAAEPSKPAKSESKTASTAVPAAAGTATPTPKTAAPTPANTPAPAPVAASDPPKPTAPEPMREKVSGNTYTNDTYGFSMYKPPDWQVIVGARTMLPGSITAMGTDDDRTYLLIGLEPAGKSLETDIEASEHRLRDIMDNFRPLGESHITVSGVSAIEHRFRGSVDQHDWSGVAVFVPHGTQLYTIFGMTLADNDLVQIQENVIARAIASLQFTRQ